MKATLKKAEVTEEGIKLILAVDTNEKVVLEIGKDLALSLGDDVFQVLYLGVDATIAKVTYTFGDPGHYKIEREPVEGREMEYGSGRGNLTAT